jgi:hypothetical protein
MESIIPNIEYDKLLQITKPSFNIIKPEFGGGEPRKSDIILRPTDHIYFVICNSCYWCASYFSIDNLDSSSKVLRCHLCNSCNTELIPISSNESFRINYNVTRGMEMEFYRNNEFVNRQESPEQQILPPI